MTPEEGSIRDRRRRRVNLALTLGPDELAALQWLVSHYQARGEPALQWGGAYNRSRVIGRLLLAERARLEGGGG